MSERTITASMFAKYASCPHWLWFDAHGDPSLEGRRTRFAEMLIERGVLHERKIIEDLEYVEPRGDGFEERFADTLRLMKEGVPRIYQGALAAGDMRGIPDLLEKRTDRPSDLGHYHYVAVDIKSAERLSDVHRYQLVFYGELLKEVQGRRPEEGYVLNGSGVRIGFALREFELRFHQALREIRAILDGKRPPPQLSSGCKSSPWFAQCIALAEADNDVTLLYNVKKKTLDGLRGLGIRTVEDAADMDVAAVRRSSPDLTKKTLERAKVQAQALLDGRHRVRKGFRFPDAATEVYFDIEGDPLRAVEYLFGFLIKDGSGERYERFLARRPEDEGAMWREFLEWTARLPDDYAVYHYGTYEKARLTTLESRHGGSPHLGTFRDRMIDLNEVVKDAIVFPLYFYSIKDIGKYVGFERGGAISGGGESVAFYEDWLRTGDERVMDDIILYNKDDVIATRALKDWMAKEAHDFEQEEARR